MTAAGRSDDRVLIATGAILAAAGLCWQSRITPGSAYVPAILGPAVLISTGGGLLNTPLTTTVTSGVAPADAGAASGLMNTAKQFGGALGLAALLVIAGRATRDPVTPAIDYGAAFVTMAVISAMLAVLAVARPPRRDTPMKEC